MVRCCAFAVLLGACGRIAFDPLHDGPGAGLRVAEVVAGSDYTCARSSRGEVTCWGDDTWGKLGLASADVTPRGDQPGELAALGAIDLGTGLTATALAARADSTCAILSDTRIKCWGNDDGGQLASGVGGNRGDNAGEMGDALPAVPIAGGGPFEQVIVGHYHACFLRAGSVWCEGLNDVSQNGYGDAMPRTSLAVLTALTPINLGAFSPVELTAEFNATCARDAAGRVKCWGYNPHGELGLGDTADRGNVAAQMGDALPFVALPGGVVPTQVSAGNGPICVVASGTVRCWGQGANGALGTGDVQNRGDNPGELATLAPLPLGAAVSRVSSGYSFVCALLSTGEVACWGLNDKGQLGLGDRNDRGDNPGEVSAALRVPLPERAVDVVAGGEHACAILASGAMACWGGNSVGQLGAGDTQNRGDDPGELPFVIQPTDLWPP